VVQAAMGRYVITTGETTLTFFSRVPGPKLLVNWVVWAWFAATVMILFALTGMYIGVSQVLNGLFPAISVTAWVMVFFVLTLVLLLGGAYPRIEKIALIKVALFTLITCLSAVILMNMPQYFSWGDVLDGLKFKMPEGDGLAVAIAVFGITGVASGELCIYPYWCIEKGYARFAGPREDTDAWRRRAHGWTRVMHVDVVVSMIVYTFATIAFYLLGAGILHGMGLVPATSDMIPILSNIYTQTLGPWAKYVFYVGAVIILYGTIFAATAGHSRMLSDFMRLQGVFEHDDYKARMRWRDIFIVVLTVIPVIMFFIFGEQPVAMVTWGGLSQAWTLPVISFGTVYLIQRYLPKELNAPAWMTVLLWLGATVITAFVLISEFRRWFM